MGTAYKDELFVLYHWNNPSLNSCPCDHGKLLMMVVGLLCICNAIHVSFGCYC